MLRIGRGIDREAVRRAVERGSGLTVTYTDVLRAEDIREALAGLRAAGSPAETRPLLAWLASHPNAPADVLHDLHADASREVLLSLALNPNLPEDLRRALLDDADEDVRTHAHHVFSRTKKH